MKLKTAIGIREIGAIVLGIMVAGLAYASWNAYRDAAEPAVVTVAPSGQDDSNIELEQMASLVARPKSPAGRYHIVEERNLFNQSRTAWEPPKKQPQKPKKKPKEKPKPKAPPPKGNEVLFYGSYLAGKKQLAIIDIPLFRGSKKQFLVTEGDTVKDPDGQRKEEYTILDIARDSLTVRNQDGYEFVVGLTDRDRRGPSKTVNKTNIVNEKPKKPENTVVKVEAPKASQSAPDTQAGSKPEPKQPTKSEKAGLPSDWHKMSDDKKDVLVQEGKLQKFITPFGPSYGPVEK